MKKTDSIKIYAKSSPEKHETLFSGIKFLDFMECAPTIENILLLKGNFLAEKNWRKFELLEGKNQIGKLMLEDVHNYGDLCFVDYTCPDSISRINDEQIAELLYLSHMFKPLKSPFFEVLQNKFAYLAHDDGWYCKLYCENHQIPTSILLYKFQKIIQRELGDITPLLPKELDGEIHKAMAKGVLIELDIFAKKKNITEMITLALYEVGEHEDMDSLFNNLEQVRLQALFEMRLP